MAEAADTELEATTAARQEPDSADEAVAEEEILAHRAEFPPMEPHRVPHPGGTLSRFFDVTVTVSVELGRVTLPIGELVKLGKGSVIELDRDVDQPVDLVAQGVRLARGEVIVVNDRYAIRIDEIDGAEPAANRRAASSSVKRSASPSNGHD
jgi:flagellar motor switch protein FliN/FliY